MAKRIAGKITVEMGVTTVDLHVGALDCASHGPRCGEAGERTFRDSRAPTRYDLSGTQAQALDTVSQSMSDPAIEKKMREIIAGTPFSEREVSSDQGFESEYPPLTPEEVEFLAIPDEELRKRAKVFSFNVKQFCDCLQVADEWQTLIYAHLYFDHIISQMLSEGLAKPDALNLSRMGFFQKLQLVWAVGLLPEELVPPIEALNNLRNKMVHNIDFKLTDRNTAEFVSRVPPRVKKIQERNRAADEWFKRFADALRDLLVHIEIIRQQHVYNRLCERKGAIDMKDIMRESDLLLQRLDARDGREPDSGT
ncbi:MAG: hypothetical protein JO216_00025 [Hyphomicrobiales bacterium]|nr:hypothetical protein [Hyphomicrobiales bacterium]